jgi:excisionase family DNA binding protein
VAGLPFVVLGSRLREVAASSGIGWWAYDRMMLTVAEASQRLGRSTSTIRRRIRSGLLPAGMTGGRWRIDRDALDEIRDGIYPMLELPSDWRKLAEGTPAPECVTGVALSRIGR